MDNDDGLNKPINFCFPLKRTKGFSKTHKPTKIKKIGKDKTATTFLKSGMMIDVTDTEYLRAES